jgi:hypothetical protein
LLAGVSPARADVGEMANGRFMVVHESSLAARSVPVGAGVGTRMSLRYMLFPKGHEVRERPILNALLAPAHLGLGTVAEVSPAFVRAGVGVEFMPLAVWRMRLTYHATQTFGLFGFMTQFDQPQDEYNPVARIARAHVRGAAQARVVHRLMGENLLQAKVWRLLAFNLTNVEGFTALDGGYFYSGEYDMLLRGRGELVLRNVFLGAVSLLDGPGVPELAVGGFHMFTRSMFTHAQSQQVGLAVVAGPPMRGRIPRGFTWIILAGVHLQDRYHALHPYLVWLATLAF